MLRQQKPRKPQAPRPKKRWHLWKQPRSLKTIQVGDKIKIYTTNIWKEGTVLETSFNKIDKKTTITVKVSQIKKLIKVTDKINLLVPREP